MQFIYHEEAKNQTIELKGEKFKHLIKARRKKVGDSLHVRNLEDSLLYLYSIDQIQRNSATLSFISKKEDKKSPSNLTLAWAVVDPKTIEKTLPMLNEMGVEKIDFIYTDFSQKNFKIDLDRVKRILINSCEQCGRSELMEFKVYEDLEGYLKEYPNTYLLDFGGKSIEKTSEKISILIGCEGGFSKSERELFAKDKILGFDHSLILRSETAICAVSAKILL